MPIVIAPWLKSPDTLGAISAGANAGLALRRQNDAQEESADRLSLAYNQLASQEKQADQAAQAKRQIATATLALKGKQMESMDAYRQGQLDAKAVADQLRVTNMQRLAAQFKEREGRMSDQFNRREDRVGNQFEETQADKEAREKRLGDQFKQRLTFDQQKADDAPGRLEPSAAAQLQVAKSELASTRKQVDAIDAEGGPHRKYFGLGKGNTEEYKALKTKEKALLEQMEAFKTTKQQSGSSQPKAKLIWNPKTQSVEPAQ